MLETCGELGYRRTSVQAVIDRYGGNRSEFYAIFPNKERCYLDAYEMEGERLCRSMLRGTAEVRGMACLHQALTTLAQYLGQRPLRARGLLVEAHVVAGPALRFREEFLERLSRALDRARRETESRHSPPPLTANFIVRAIDATATAALVKGDPESFASIVPEIEQLAALYYTPPA